jgi:hypothetical protein
MADNNKLMVVDESTLKDKIYTIRGQQVMLDFDLAEIYGYETKNFNRQVKNNIERFEGDDFMFRLTKEECDNLRCKNFTSSWGGSRYLPYAFTEQGIYMLMTVLKGDLAIEQSRNLVRLFKAMKDYLIENQPLLTQKNYFALVDKVEENTKEIKEMRENMVSKAELSDFMKLFDQGLSNEEVLILNGKPFKADEAYQKIYRCARSKILIIDDYIGTKTLHHLAHSKKTAKITIISDNAARPKLSLAEYNDFLTENPGRNITFLQSLHRSHDRYIVLDEGTKDMKVYHCGASSKDAGNRITTITRVSDIDEYKPTIKAMLGHPTLVLR